MLEVTSLCGQICLGKQGENLARVVYFDEPELWKSTFGEGDCQLIHQRSGDEAPYPVVLEIIDGKVCWKVSAADTAIVGEGKCELHYIVDNVIVKSKIWTTTVLPSLGEATAEPPEPEKAWVDQVLNAAEKVEDATTHQPVIGENKNWFVWDFETEQYVDSGVCAVGIQGEQGVQGIQGIQCDKAEKGEKGEKGEDGIGIGKPTEQGGEIFNLYEDTETDIEYNGIRIGKQTLPKNTAGQYAHAEGVSTAASGEGSHAEGVGTVAGAGSHVEGRGINFTVNVTEINGNVVTVKSNNSNEILKPYELEAIKKNAVVWCETDSTKHNGEFYYVVNAYTNKVLGVATSSELVLNKAPNFSVGTNLTVFLGSALSYISHVEGNYCNAVDIEATNLNGKEESGKQRQHAEGSRTLSLGYASHSEGEYTIALGGMSHAEGNNTKSEGAHSHAEGQDTNAIGLNSHAEGWNTFANGQQSHAEGCDTKANADNSHAEGYRTEAHGTNSHAEGNNTRTWSSNAHAEGNSTSASGTNSHAEGNEAKANGENAHAEGHNTRASGKNSHAEGESTTASGENAHAEGNNTKAWANNSHVSGLGTRSTRENQNVCGSYNKDNDDAIHIVGNGTNENNRSNAFEVYADGHAEVQTMGDTDNSVATKEYVDNLNTYDFDETYIITEEEATATKWERTVDLQGNPIRLTEMQVDFTIPAGENTGVQYLYFHYERENGSTGDEFQTMRVTEFAYQNATKERYIKTICYKLRESFYAIQGYAWNYEDNYTAMQSTLGTRMNIGNFLNNPTILRGLYFNVANGMPVAGTVVRIRGRRA